MTGKNISHSYKTTEGDLVQLVGLHHGFHLFFLKHGNSIQTHRGVIQHDNLIGKEWGSMVKSHSGNPFFLLQPSLSNILESTKRSTQIMYPKDIGFILITMGIVPGVRVIEAGSGSGAFTSALASMVREKGRVYSYEILEEKSKLAEENTRKLGLDSYVEFKVRDIQLGFDEKNVDAIFLDLPNPFDFLHQVHNSLKPGGYFGTILPSTNQVIKTIVELKRNSFGFIDVCETMLRYYQVDPDRFRPTDRMVAHTGYLVFARKVIKDDLYIDQSLDSEE